MEAVDLRAVQLQWCPPEDTSASGVRGCLEAYVVEWWRWTEADDRDAQRESQVFRTGGCDETPSLALPADSQPKTQAALIVGSRSGSTGSGSRCALSSAVRQTLTELPGMTTVTLVVRVRNRKFLGPDSNHITFFTPEGGKYECT